MYNKALKWVKVPNVNVKDLEEGDLVKGVTVSANQEDSNFVRKGVVHEKGSMPHEIRIKNKKGRIDNLVEETSGFNIVYKAVPRFNVNNLMKRQIVGRLKKISDEEDLVSSSSDGSSGRLSSGVSFDRNHSHGDRYLINEDDVRDRLMDTTFASRTRRNRSSSRSNRSRSRSNRSRSRSRSRSRGGKILKRRTLKLKKK